MPPITPLSILLRNRTEGKYATSFGSPLLIRGSWGPNEVDAFDPIQIPTPIAPGDDLLIADFTLDGSLVPHVHANKLFLDFEGGALVSIPYGWWATYVELLWTNDHTPSTATPWRATIFGYWTNGSKHGYQSHTAAVGELLGLGFA